MNPTDHFLLEKAFPMELRTLFYLLTSEDNAVKKALNYYNYTYVNSLKREDALPCNLYKFMELLQKSIMIPLKTEIVKSPVLFAMSLKTRLHVIQFLQLKKNNNIEFTKWLEFLSKNYSQLDKWSKIVSNETLGNNKIEVLSNASVIKLTKKFGIRSFLTENPTTNHTSVENKGSKRRRLHSPEDEPFVSDTDERTFPPEEKSKLENVEFQKNNESSDANHLQTCPDITQPMEEDINSKYHVAGSSSHTVHSEFVVENSTEILDLKEKLSSGKSLYSDCSRLLKLFTNCSTADVSLICEKVQIVKFKEEILQNIFIHFIESDLLSFEKLKYILYYGITIRIFNADEPISRKLFAVITEVFEKAPRATLPAVFSEVLAFADFKPKHEEFIKRLVSNRVLKTQDIGSLLDYTLECLSLKLSEHLLSIIEYLLQQKSVVTNIFFVVLVRMMSEQIEQFCNSLILMKTLLTIFKNYSEYMKDKTDVLKRIIDQNSTFLKKKVLYVLNHDICK